MTECKNGMIFDVSAKKIISLEITIQYDNNRSKKLVVTEGDLLDITSVNTTIDSKIDVEVTRGKLIECNECYLMIDASEQFESKLKNIFIKNIREIFIKNLEAEPLEESK